jgi:hypothetical protein
LARLRFAPPDAERGAERKEEDMKMSLKRGKLLAAVCALVVSTAVAAGAMPRHAQVPDDGWVTFKSDEFGYSLYYPSTFFEPQAIAAAGEPKTFLSPDRKAKLVVSGVDNQEGISLARYRSALLDEFGGYDALDYSPTGKSWFVLSGYRGDTIYYQKVLFSCGDRIINLFSITFPAADRAFYEGLIEVMEDNFRPGHGTDAPARCRSQS